MEGSAGFEARGSARMEGSVGDPRKGAREGGRMWGCRRDAAAGGDAWRMRGGGGARTAERAPWGCERLH
jgi:hypothetical protein